MRKSSKYDESLDENAEPNDSEDATHDLLGDEAWDEWYDYIDFFKKKSKIKRSKKRLFKDRGEW